MEQVFPRIRARPRLPLNERPPGREISPSDPQWPHVHVPITLPGQHVHRATTTAHLLPSRLHRGWILPRSKRATHRRLSTDASRSKLVLALVPGPISPESHRQETPRSPWRFHQPDRSAASHSGRTATPGLFILRPQPVVEPSWVQRQDPGS